MGSASCGQRLEAFRKKSGISLAATTSGERFELLLRSGKIPIQKQIGGFHEGGSLRQFFDAIAPVNENPLFAVDVADLGVSHRHPSQSDIFHTHASAIIPSLTRSENSR